MKRNMKKEYYAKRPSHPATAHTKAKSWFKQKSRKQIRKWLKNTDYNYGKNA